MKIEDIVISATNFSLNPGLRAFVRLKSKKLLRHSHEIIHLSIELTKCDQNKHYQSTGHLHLKKKPIIIHSSSDNIRKCIDQLFDKLDRQLRRHSRIQKFKRYIPFVK